MHKYFLVTIAVLCFGLFSCTSPDLQKQINDLAMRQDSMYTVLKKMQSQTNFIAKKVGWEPPEDTLPKNIPVSHSYIQGAESPILTIVEFSDFQCPYCARVAPVLDSLVKTYPKQVRVIFKHFPLSFHKQAMGAHAAALAAGKQGRFYDFRYKIASKYRDLSDSVYIALAEEIGLDVEEFKKEMTMTPEVRKLIDEDIKLGSSIGVRGTPTLFANGKKVNDRSFSGFEKLLVSLGGVKKTVKPQL